MVEFICIVHAIVEIINIALAMKLSYRHDTFANDSLLNDVKKRINVLVGSDIGYRACLMCFLRANVDYIGSRSFFPDHVMFLA